MIINTQKYVVMKGIVDCVFIILINLLFIFLTDHFKIRIMSDAFRYAYLSFYNNVTHAHCTRAVLAFH